MVLANRRIHYFDTKVKDRDDGTYVDEIRDGEIQFGGNRETERLTA